LRRRQIDYGREVNVVGRAPVADAGQQVMLEFAAADSSSWRSLTTARVGPRGRFRLIARLRQSGLVRVVGASGAAVARALSMMPTTPTAGAPVSIAPSRAERVTVSAELAVPSRSWELLGGGAIDLQGKLLPGVSGRQVRLEGRAAGGWQALASARTGPRGGFRLRYATGGLGQQQLRVRFAGDRQNGSESAAAGAVTTYRASVASWYDDGGATACGFHANFGVANRSLPCGTQVTFHYGGRTVTAVVDDRGPFVGGREWDLNQNVAAALGFGGVDTVWSSV
jgi:hypothetical protein